MEGLNLSLRNNPSVIVVGEARTHDEIRSMVDIAMRGHLVFSTLHTSSVLNTLRFLDSLSETKDSWRQMLAYSIKAIVAQKLIYKKDSGFLLIPEVFIPNDQVRAKLAKGEFSDIKDMFYTNTLRDNGCYTFRDSIEILVRERLITGSERSDLLVQQGI